MVLEPAGNEPLHHLPHAGELHALTEAKDGFALKADGIDHMPDCSVPRGGCMRPFSLLLPRELDAFYIHAATVSTSLVEMGALGLLRTKSSAIEL